MIGKVCFGLSAALVVYAVLADFIGLGILALKVIVGEP